MFLSNADGFKKFARGLFYVFIAVFPFIQYQGFLFNGTSSRAMNLVLVAGVLAIVLAISLFRKNTKLTVLKSPISIGLIFFFLILLVSSLLGVDFATSFWSKVTRMSGLYYFLHLGLFYFLMTSVFQEENKMKTFIKVFLISAGIFSIGSLIEKNGFGLIFNNREWAGFTFGNSSFAAMYLYTGFMLSIYYVLSIQRSVRSWWHYLIPLVFVVSPYLLNIDLWFGRINIFQTPFSIVGSAQASSYAMIFSVLMLLGVWGISKIRSLKIRKSFIWGSAVLGLVVGVWAVSSFLSPNGFIQEAYLKQATNARPIVWSLSQEAIKDKPAFGFGVDNFDRAFEANYDSRIMEKANGGEAWFDRAHNIFIDQAIETGYIGVTVYVLLYLLIIGSMMYVIFCSKERNQQIFAVIIIAYFIGHLMELQTVFDTTISYVPLVMMASFATILFHRVYKERVGEKSEWVTPLSVRYFFGAGLIIVFGTLFFVGTYPIFKAQIANGAVRTIGSSDKRLPIYSALFGSPVDAAGFLNRTVTDLQRGIGLDPSILSKPGRMDGFKKELDVFVLEYQNYLESHPTDYRALIKLTDLYIYQRLFEVNNLALAQETADRAIALVPEAPQAYWQKSVAYLYERKFDLAREWAKKAYDLNPSIEESKVLLDYIEKSIKTFPAIGLYNFRMI